MAAACGPATLTGMNRAPELIPLSHDHHQALFVALQLRRATPATLDAALAALHAFWEGGGAAHFAAEEAWFVPGLSDAPGWDDAVARMLDEHADLRARIAAVGDLAGAHELGDRLRDHVRFEERELFGMVEATLG
jgi:hypothetical protein